MSDINLNSIVTLGNLKKYDEIKQVSLETSLDKKITDYSKEYLTFISLEDNNTIGWKANDYLTRTISISTDGGQTWVNKTSVAEEGISEIGGTPVISDPVTLAVLNTGDKLLVKGSNSYYANSSSNYNYFTSTKQFNVEGNIMSLIYGDNFIDQNVLSSDYTFAYLFKNNTRLIDASNLILSATTLRYYCYYRMFYQCSALVLGPKILPAKTLNNYCYSEMFSNCTSLTTAPTLPATTLTSYCYYLMFRSCVSLITAPELPATTLESYCYANMFLSCLLLATAPELPATTLALGCYSNMFNGCLRLNYVKCLATNINASNCTTNWLSNVLANGVFIKPISTNWTTGNSGIPSSWTVLTESEYELVHKYELTDLSVNKTYSELKSMRDNSQLTPGQWYRITDYVTTTAQENTQSAGHQFDIIVKADASDSLNENAHAALHSGDTYFSGSTLESWELKYCIDNDTNRFAWADTTNGKGVIYYMKDEFGNECPYDFKNILFKRYRLKNQNGLHLADYPMEDGKCSGSTQVAFDIWKSKLGNSMTSSNAASYYVRGVYSDGYLVSGAEIYDYTSDYESYDDGNLTFDDESGGNYIGVACIYDCFDVIAEVENTNGEWFYTFSKKSTTADTATDASFDTNCYENSIKAYLSGGIQELNDNIFIVVGNSLNVRGNSFDINCQSNSFGNNCNYNSFGNNCYGNSFGKYCQDNSFGNDCISNSFGNSCYSNSFVDECSSNSFGNNCSDNSFGNNCNYNSFWNNCNYNSFGNNCHKNLFVGACRSNSFGNECYINSFGNECHYNSFGNNCYSNSFGTDCYGNSFGNDCGNIQFWNDCSYNSFGNNCSYISLHEECKYNLFDNYCAYISFLKDYSCYNIVENGNQYIDVTSTQTTSSSQKLRNITISQGVNTDGTPVNKKTISHNTLNDAFQTVYKSTNSVDVLL